MLVLLSQQKKEAEKKFDERKKIFQKMRQELEENIQQTTVSYDDMKQKFIKEMEERLQSKETELKTTEQNQEELEKKIIELDDETIVALNYASLNLR